MTHNIYIYMLIMALVTYLIRVLPLTLIRKEITNTFNNIYALRAHIEDYGNIFTGTVDAGKSDS